jgi:PAS domain S-box-containing protein
MPAAQPAPDPISTAGAPSGGPWHRHPRLRRLGETLLLAAAALLGNYFSMTLFFGVEMLFGSVAALLAVARLGTVPGIVVAGVGGSYTLLLWHHPYALVIFVLEVTAIGWHRDWAARRGEPPAPLAVSAALYWLLLGIPLVLLFYQGLLGLGWLPTALVAAKQAVNGILNAALASALLLAGALLQARRGLPRLDELLFSLLLTAALVPALVITAWENSDLKDWQEQEAANNLRLLGGVALDRLAQASASGPEPLAAALARVGDIARDRLHRGAAPRLFIANRHTGMPLLGDAVPTGDVIESAVPDMLLVLPAVPTSSAMQRWRATRYRIALRADALAAGHDLVIDISAEPLIDLVQQRLLRPLVALFLLALAAVLLARTLSRRIVAPLNDLAQVARALPTALREGRAPPQATPGLFAESADFSAAVNAMGASLRQSFDALAAERDEQARGRALLRVSEARLTEAQAIAHIGSWEWDIGTGALTWSDETYKILGYEQGAVIPTLESFLAVVHPEDRDRVHEAIAAAQKHPDGHYEAEFRVRGPNGAELIQRARGRVHFDADGRPLRIAGTAQDITEQRRMERALRAERERYRMVVEHLEDLLVRVDTDGRFEFVSPSYCRLFGKTEAELIGRTFMPLVHPEDRAATAAAMERLFAPPHTVTMEQRVETVRGERWLQWSDRAVLDAAGQVVGIVGLGRDITERKAAEQALRASEQHFRALFETIGEGVVYYDADGRVVDVNPAGVAMMGIAREALIGTPPDDQRGHLITEEGTPLSVDEYPSRIALATGRSTEPQVLGLVVGKTVRWGLLQAHVERPPGADRPQRVFVTFADITSLLETRQRLQAIVDSSPHGIIAVDVASREIRWCNEAMEQLFGYGRDELIGRSIAALYPPDASAVLVDEIDLAGDNLDRHGPGLLAYVPCRRRDGSRFYCNVAPGLARLGSAQVMTAFFSDATLEYESRRALEHSRQALLDAQALAHIGSWEYDSARDRLTWSPEVFRIFEQDEAVFGASFEAFQRVVHPDERAHLVETYRTAEATLGEYELVHRLLLHDEHVKWVHERAHFVRDAAGGSVLARGTVQDITERRLAELKLDEREAMLRELLSVATDFVDTDETDIERVSAGALARIGASIGADRSYLFDYDPVTEVFSMPLEWTADGIAPTIEACRQLPLAAIPAIGAALARQEPVAVASVDELPPTWTRERELFLSQDIKALLLAPVYGAGALRGVVGFDAVRAPRVWTEVERHFLQVFANILASARKRAEILAALRITNARYEDVSRQSRTMAWEVDPDGRYTYVNSASITVYGEPPEALLGRCRTDLLRTDARAERSSTEPRLAEAAVIEDFVFPGCRRDGSTLWVLTNGVPILDADGRVAGYRGTDKDITEQYLAEQALKASRARLAAVFDNAPIGMALLDAERRLVLVNQALAALVGARVEDLTGRSADEVTHPDDLRLARRRFDDLLAGRSRSVRITRRFVRTDGRVVWGDQRIVLLPTAPGEPPAPLAMVEDVTELHLEQEQRRKLETTLAASTARLEEMLDLVNLSQPAEAQITALLTLARRALTMESAQLALVEAAVPQAPETLAVASDLPAPAPPPPARLLDAALATRGAPVAACEDLGAAAEAADLGCCVALALAGADDTATAPVQLMLVLWGRRNRLVLDEPVRQQLRLIAQRIAAVRTQAQMQQDLVQAKERESIGHLASGVAHDFNNLLGVIGANLFFMQDALADCARGDPELAQAMEETLSALSQARVVTSGIMSLSQAGGVPLAQVQLAASIDELVRILRHLLPDNVALETDVPPNIAAWTNSAFLQSALLNLALNARDAMPGGGRLCIAAATCRWHGGALLVGELPAGDYVELAVDDSGSGIAPDVLGRIFEPLYSTKAKGRGHGLGLFMVREFVLRAGAGMLVDSAAGRGTRFRLLLPRQAPVASGTPPAQTAGKKTAPSLAGLKVLVVDDDPRVRDAVARLLAIQGVDTALAEHGEAALARLAQAPGIDLVLTDIAMPVLDGAGLRRRVREEHPGLPVLLMTGQHSDAVADDTGSEQATLRKPVEPAELYAAIRALTGRSGEAGGPG